MFGSYVKHADGSISETLGVGHYPGIAGYDDVESVLKIASLVWNPLTLTWDKALQIAAGGGDASAANQILGNASLTSIDTKLPALVGGRIPVALPAGASGLTDAELRATPVPVSGAFYQVTQPVSLSDLDARILGRVKIWDGVDVALITAAGALSVDTGFVQGLTDAQLRASAVSVDVSDKAARDLGKVRIWDGVDTVLVSAGGEVSVVATNLDVALSTRLKPADTLTGVTTLTSLTQMNGQAIAMGTGVRSAGTQRVTVATDDVVQCVGEIAHDGVDSGNPQKIGGIARTALAAVSTALDRVSAMFDMYGRQIIAKKDQWTAIHVPAVATQATIAQAAAGAGIKNVCTSITCTLSSTAAPTAGSVIFELLDGATVKWTGRLSLQAVAGVCAAPICLTDLWIEGTANATMTLRTQAAPPANNFATVSMTGTITQ